MADVIAVVSKAIFEKAAREHALDVGMTWPTASYVSQNKALGPLADGGRLFLVTVRPPDEALWLVGVLESPTFDGTQWKADENTIAIRDVSPIKRSIKFESGAGLPEKTGVLGMSLQTPRVLAASDIPLLLGKVAKSTPATSDARRPKETAKPKTKAEPATAPAVAAGPASSKGARSAFSSAGDPGDLLRLMASLGCAHSPVALERVKRLAKRDDPRLVPGLLGILEKPPYTGGSSKKFWQTVVATLEASRDIRARDGMVSLSRRYKKINGTFLGDWLAGAMSRAATKMKIRESLPPAQEAKLDALEMDVLGASQRANPSASTQPKASLDDIFAQIVAQPDDDGPRLVYADLLSERGDERGELIVLQVERAAGKGTPERADIERRKFVEGGRIEDWEAPLSAAANKIEFERGFPVAVSLGKQGLQQVVDAVEWGTVRKLTGITNAPYTAALKLLNGDRARNLVHVESLGGKMFDKLTHPTLAWRRVALINDKLAPAQLARLPELTELEIVGEGSLSPEFFAAAPKLTAVTLADPTSDDSAALFVMSPKLAKLTLEDKVDAKKFAGLSIEHLSVRADFAEAGAWLHAIPSVRSIELSPNKLDWKRLVALFDSHPNLQRIAFQRFIGIFTAAVERTKNELTLVVPPGERWAGFYEELAEIAEQLKSVGIGSLVMDPKEPRHLRKPLGSKELDPIRKAWGPKHVEIRELL